MTGRTYQLMYDRFKTKLDLTICVEQKGESLCKFLRVGTAVFFSLLMVVIA